jgi:hypothetical protein
MFCNFLMFSWCWLFYNKQKKNAEFPGAAKNINKPYYQTLQIEQNESTIR